MEPDGTALKGKVALVIGASRGMGREMALLLARDGADIVVAARTMTPDQPMAHRPDGSRASGSVEETVAQIKELGVDALAVKCDLMIDADVDEMCRRAVEWRGHLDIVVYNSFYMGPGYISMFTDTTMDQLEAAFRVNLISAVRVCKNLVPPMAASGGGTIICISSGSADGGLTSLGGLPGHGGIGLGYPMTKAGLNRFVETLASEVRHQHISVAAVNPGMTESNHMAEGKVGHSYIGYDTRNAHSPVIPAKVVWFICSSPAPMSYTGKIIDAMAFAKQYGF